MVGIFEGKTIGSRSYFWNRRREMSSENEIVQVGFRMSPQIQELAAALAKGFGKTHA